MPVLLWQNSLPKLLWGQTGSLASDKIQTVLARLPLSLASFLLAHRRTYFRFRICNWQGSRGAGKKPLTLKPIFRGGLKPKFCEFFVNICDSEKKPSEKSHTGFSEGRKSRLRLDFHHAAQLPQHLHPLLTDACLGNPPALGVLPLRKLLNLAGVEQLLLRLGKQREATAQLPLQDRGNGCFLHRGRLRIGKQLFSRKFSCIQGVVGKHAAIPVSFLQIPLPALQLVIGGIDFFGNLHQSASNTNVAALFFCHNADLHSSET